MATTPLFPAFQMPVAVPARQGTQPTVQYRKAYRWDWTRGDVALDGAGRVPQCEGYEAAAQWAMKQVLTPRYASPIYSRQTGTEMDRALRQSNQALIQADLERTIREAIKIDRRVKDATHFQFTWDDGALTVAFTITFTVGTTRTIEVLLHA